MHFSRKKVLSFETVLLILHFRGVYFSESTDNSTSEVLTTPTLEDSENFVNQTVEDEELVGNKSSDNRTGVSFIKILRAAFAPVDLKRVKRY